MGRWLSSGPGRPRIEYTVKNLANVLMALNRIRYKSAAVLIDATLAGGERVRSRAVQLAPYLTGTLRRSIHVEPIISGRTRCLVVIGTDVVYAARQEFGFVGPDSLGRVYHQPPHPYLRPAIEQEAAGVVKDIHTVVRAILWAGAR